jgi:glycosyltransferase involved in cell wall biosynthesis
MGVYGETDGLLGAVWETEAPMKGETDERPLVSVVIAAYQADRFLADALESARAQSYPRVEVVVVDDGSTDSTGAVATRFSEVRSLRLGENQGVAAARNAGVAVARGELITFLDADDVMFPDRVDTQVRYLQAHPLCVCVLARHELWTEDGIDTSWIARDPVFGDWGGVEPGSAMVPAWVAHAVPFDPAYRVGQGLEWLGRVVDEGGSVEVCPEPLWRRRIHRQNLSQDREALRREMLRMARSRARQRGGV